MEVNRQQKTWAKPVDKLDVWLDERGYYRKHTARDASCLFRVFSEQLLLTQAHHSEVRRQILDYVLRNKRVFEKMVEGPLEDYVDRMRSVKECGGPVEIQAAAEYYKVDIILFHTIGQLGEPLTNYGHDRSVMLCRSLEKHYDSVYTKQYINDSAYCQSLLYEQLYKKVFKLKEVDYAVRKMLRDKSAKFQREVNFYNDSYLHVRMEMRDTYSNVKELLDLGITPFPYKVAKSLDVEVYRNVEFDIWNDYRKGLRYGLCPWTCKELQVGVKCTVNLNNTSYQGHIQEMQPNKGPVVVFVVELGEKITVPFEALELIPPTEPPTPTRPPTNRLSLYLNEGKMKEVTGCGNNKETPTENSSQPLVSSSNYYEDDGNYSNQRFENYAQQESFNGGEADSTKGGEQVTSSGEGVYCHDTYSRDQQSTRMPPLLAGRPHDPTEVPHPDMPTLRFFYNLGLEHMRMNCMVRPTQYFVNPAALPPSYIAFETPSTPTFEQPQFPAHLHPIPPTVPGMGEWRSNVEGQQEGVSSESEGSQSAMPPRFKKKAKQANSVKKKSHLYEGVPLVQQYEVSSSTGGPTPQPVPLYYPTVELEPPPYCPLQFYTADFAPQQAPLFDMSYQPPAPLVFPPPEPTPIYLPLIHHIPHPPL